MYLLNTTNMYTSFMSKLIQAKEYMLLNNMLKTKKKFIIVFQMLKYYYFENKLETPRKT